MPAWKSGSNFDAFHALEEEKQTRIINAALVEFSVKGYKRASTNVIAEKAQIGKGMLFYYFGSKEELFHFLCEYTIEFAG
ncbi:MAG: TetR/AcrR family transcriptional regulator [Muricomes sp.]